MLFNSPIRCFFAIVYSLYLLARDRVQQNIIDQPSRLLAAMACHTVFLAAGLPLRSSWWLAARYRQDARQSSPNNGARRSLARSELEFRDHFHR